MPNTTTLRRHGGPYDRGGADSYYRRGRCPHYYVGDSYSTPKVVKADMTEEEIAAYNCGYDENEEADCHKEWN